MLVKQLPDGPLDIVGDVHGEIAALKDLLDVMGYSADGDHPAGRRLVFVGDLTDRGPDSPAIVDFVDRLVSEGRGDCVLGNHDLNLLLGLRKYDNGWFFGETFEYEGHLIPQRLADDALRAKAIDLFQKLPVALERPGLKVVHAYWDAKSIEAIRDESNVVDVYREHKRRIAAECEANGADAIDIGLRHQNENPVKLLTSGLERRAETPSESSGKLRYEERVKWWEDMSNSSDGLTVFGHYALDQQVPRTGSAICSDYGVAKRYRERIVAGFRDHKLRLAAVQIPEKVVVFDDGTQHKL